MIKIMLSVLVPVLALAAILLLMAFAAQGASVPVLDTKGTIANSQRDTLYIAVAVMLLVIVPVFVLLLFISIRYRESNKTARYMPEWASSNKLEAIWWGVPVIIVTVLSVVIWHTSHSLDPYRPIESSQKPIQVQVISLQWKWLFIYPEYNVAAINMLVIPVNKPVEFTLTSDAPMNSFWIPQLGGQIYTMSGMSTKLHLQADESGRYEGYSANLSGKGHAAMNFKTYSYEETEFNKWKASASKSNESLDHTTYEQLRLPSLNNKVVTYRLDHPSLYDSVVERYGHSHGTSTPKKNNQEGSY